MNADPGQLRTQLRVYQINCNRSLIAQSHVINLDAKDWDIICIQEPYVDWRGLSRSTPPWRVVYPYRHTPTAKSRSLILVSKHISTDAWEALPVDSLDITAIQMSGNFGKIRLFNVYNACENAKSTEALDEYLLTSSIGADNSTPTYDIWLGDFNRHDPMWEDPAHKQLFTRKHLDEAEVLISLLADYGMEMALPRAFPHSNIWSPKRYTASTKSSAPLSCRVQL